jgi:uncharacterized repeat protein (TIGR03837 family)
MRMRWDLYCRVIDNHGDIGVCWRLARQLATRGDTVRLVVDDPSALAWMAPAHEATDPGVTVWRWPGTVDGDAPDVVVEAFGCDPPAAAVQAMRAAATPPLWINLEYLSAEDYVERSHGLPSPRADGLRKWFFYPGFTARTGGLLREPDLLHERARFDRDAWLTGIGAARAVGERVVSLFCYANPAIGAFVQSLAAAPTLLLVTPGEPTWQLQALRAAGAVPDTVRTLALPWLSQTDFDRLLWASDLNGVRGEDSLVRALWAGVPFLWQIYPQHDSAHEAKLRALLARLALPADVLACHLGWNGLAPWPGLPDMARTVAQTVAEGAAWRTATEAARARLLAQDDLATQLRAFVAAHHASAEARAGC